MRPRSLHRLRVVVRAREHQISRPTQGRRLFEQLGIVVFNIAEMTQQRLAEGSGRVEAGKQREGFEFRGRGRQCLRLPVLDHLQPVLDHPQEAIGLDHLRRRLRLHPCGGHQRLDRRAGGRLPQLRIAPAPDQLLGLGEELDLADAAAAKLDIMAGHGDVPVAFHRMDLPLDGMDVLDGGEIQMLAPDERPQALQEGLAGLDIAGDGPRLDHRRPFPVLTHALVIGLRRQHREGEGRGGGVGPQAQVGAEHIAGVGPLLQDAQEIPRQADEEILDRALAGVAGDFRVVEQYQIDVAGIVQLARAKFPHAQDHQPGAFQRVVGVRRRQVARVDAPLQQMPRCAVDSRVGEIAERPGHALQRQNSHNIGQSHGEGDTAPRLAQGLHQPPGIFFRCSRSVYKPLQFLQDRLRPLG